MLSEVLIRLKIKTKITKILTTVCFILNINLMKSQLLKYEAYLYLDLFIYVSKIINIHFFIGKILSRQILIFSNQTSDILAVYIMINYI